MPLFPSFKKKPAEGAEARLLECLKAPLSEFCYSGYALYTERRGKRLEFQGGRTSHWPEARAVTPTTKFDIASVTKVLVTTSCLARAVDRREIELENELAHFFPKLKNTGYANLTISDLLSHSSGVIGWYPYFEEAVEPTKLIDWFIARESSLLIEKKGKRAIYSDFGFLLLGLVVQQHWGGIASAFESEVQSPLRMENVVFGPLVERDQVVATEFSLSRHRLLQGEVFDENANALGGTAAHAGLFAPAIALAPFCREWLLARAGASSWLSRETALKFSTPSNMVAGSTWALGWDTKSKTGSTAGDRFGGQSFGGLGYTGCSIWIDPIAEGFAILLTNRVHPSRQDERFKRLRPKVHDAIFELWEEWG